MAPCIIPASYHHNLIDFRQGLIKDNAHHELNATVLWDKLEMELFDYFFETIETAFNKPFPTLVNTDGERIQFSTSYFKLMITPEETLNRLLPLTLLKHPEEFLRNAERDESGVIKRIEFSWLKKGN